MIYFIILLIIMYIIYRVFYRIQYDNIIAFTGAPGTSKSLNSVKLALKLLKRNRKKIYRKNIIIFIFNLFRIKKKEKLDKPVLYSNIPIRITRKEMSSKLTLKHILLLERLTENCIVLLDDLTLICNQFEYSNPYAIYNLEEFFSMFRQYTNGYLITNTQSSNKILCQLRYTLSQVFNLLYFKKIFCFYVVKIRNITIGEDIKIIQENQTEDNMKTKIGFINPFFKHYDSRCYSEFYKTVPQGIIEKYNLKFLKSESVSRLPSVKKNEEYIKSKTSIKKE